MLKCRLANSEAEVLVECMNPVRAPAESEVRIVSDRHANGASGWDREIRGLEGSLTHLDGRRLFSAGVEAISWTVSSLPGIRSKKIAKFARKVISAAEKELRKGKSGVDFSSSLLDLADVADEDAEEPGAASLVEAIELLDETAESGLNEAGFFGVLDQCYAAVEGASEEDAGVVSSACRSALDFQRELIDRIAASSVTEN